MTQSVDEIVALIEAQVEDFYTHQVQAKAGVVKFLSLLKMEGVWMYVATATDRPSGRGRLALRRNRRILPGDSHLPGSRQGKDSPEIFERCMRRLRSNKKDTVIFEDALHAIETAKAAGFRVCAVYDPYAEAEQDKIRAISDYYIRSFEDMFTTDTLA